MLKRLADLHASPERKRPLTDRLICRFEPGSDHICRVPKNVRVNVVKCLDGLDPSPVRCQLGAQGAGTGILFRVYDATIGAYLAAVFDTRLLSMVTNFAVDADSRMALWDHDRVAFAIAQAHGVVVGLPEEVAVLPTADRVLDIFFFDKDRLALLLSRCGKVQVDTFDLLRRVRRTVGLDVNADVVVKAVARPPLWHSQPDVAGLLAVATTTGVVHRIELVRDGPAREARPWIFAGRPVADLAFGPDTLVFATDQEVVALRLAARTGTSRRTIFRGDYAGVVTVGRRVVAYARFGGRREVSGGVANSTYHGRLRWAGGVDHHLYEVREQDDGVVVVNVLQFE